MEASNIRPLRIKSPLPSRTYNHFECRTGGGTALGSPHGHGSSLNALAPHDANSVRSRDYHKVPLRLHRRAKEIHLSSPGPFPYHAHYDRDEVLTVTVRTPFERKSAVTSSFPGMYPAVKLYERKSPW